MNNKIGSEMSLGKLQSFLSELPREYVLSSCIVVILLILYKVSQVQGFELCLLDNHSFVHR